MFEGSTEIRKPLFGNSEPSVSSTSAMCQPVGEVPTAGPVYAAGPGLRYLTPVGPARIDFGYQLNRIPGLLVNGEPEARHWRIHFSIGQAF